MKVEKPSSALNSRPKREHKTKIPFDNSEFKGEKTEQIEDKIDSGSGAQSKLKKAQ